MIVEPARSLASITEAKDGPRSTGEADQAAAAIRRAFPSFAKEIRVVNDRVLVQD